jgi:hypothetical protein
MVLFLCFDKLDKGSEPSRPLAAVFSLLNQLACLPEKILLTSYFVIVNYPHSSMAEGL